MKDIEPETPMFTALQRIILDAKASLVTKPDGIAQ